MMFRGRERLLKQLKRLQKNTNSDHLRACIQIGDLLSEYLGRGTYVVLQPRVGIEQVDILIISPEFGFRVIKIVAEKIDQMKEISADGQLALGNSNVNALDEIRQQTHNIKQYLIENFSYIATGDPYRNIGYSVIFANCSRKEFSAKFATSIKKWSTAELTNFGKHHFFLEDVSENIKHLLMNTTKFLYGKIELSPSQLQKIVDEIDILDDRKRMRRKSAVQTTESISLATVTGDRLVDRRKRKMWSAALIVVLVLFIGAAGFFIMDIKNRPFTIGNKHETPDKTSVDILDVGDYVVLTARVNTVQAGRTSDELIVTLTEGDSEITAYLVNKPENEALLTGNVYEIEGYIESLDDSRIEISVEKIK